MVNLHTYARRPRRRFNVGDCSEYPPCRIDHLRVARVRGHHHVGPNQRVPRHMMQFYSRVYSAVAVQCTPHRMMPLNSRNEGLQRGG
jgi:hypothetical protein